jgi:hypothetical protein
MGESATDRLFACRTPRPTLVKNAVEPRLRLMMEPARIQISEGNELNVLRYQKKHQYASRPDAQTDLDRVSQVNDTGSVGFRKRQAMTRN